MIRVICADMYCSRRGNESSTDQQFSTFLGFSSFMATTAEGIIIIINYNKSIIIYNCSASSFINDNIWRCI